METFLWSQFLRTKKLIFPIFFGLFSIFWKIQALFKRIFWKTQKTVFFGIMGKIRFLGFFDLFEFFKLYLREFFEIFSMLFKFFGCCVAVGAYLFFETKFFKSKIFVIFEEVNAYFYFFSSLLKTFLLRFYLVVFLWRSKRLFLLFLVKKWRNFCFFFSPRFPFFFF